MINKPCPHCGGDAFLTANYSQRVRRYFVYVKCDICGAQGKAYTSAEDPAEQEWNNEACYSAITAGNMRTDWHEDKDGL